MKRISCVHKGSAMVMVLLVVTVLTIVVSMAVRTIGFARQLAIERVQVEQQQQMLEMVLNHAVVSAINSFDSLVALSQEGEPYVHTALIDLPNPMPTGLGWQGKVELHIENQTIAIIAALLEQGHTLGVLGCRLSKVRLPDGKQRFQLAEWKNG